MNARGEFAFVYFGDENSDISNNKIMLLDTLLSWNYLHIGDCSAIPLWVEDIVNLRSKISRAVGDKRTIKCHYIPNLVALGPMVMDEKIF